MAKSSLMQLVRARVMAKTATKHMFIFGLGYVGLHLAQALHEQGWQITGTTRNVEKLASYQAKGWRILSFEDGATIPEIDHHLAQASHVLTTISALIGHDPVMQAHQGSLAKFEGWTGYVSATSIYPDQEQGFVDEDTPPAPATKRGHDRLAAEQLWQNITNAEIFRVAGIYGPNRSPFAALMEGRAKIIEKEGHFFNRIHQSDITAIIMAALDQPRPGRIINLCDNEPAPQGDVIRYAASLLKIEPPKAVKFEEADLSPMARTFYVSRRKLTSRIIGTELPVKLQYPTYREGLKAILDAEGHLQNH